jgi:hypothetical protein
MNQTKKLKEAFKNSKFLINIVFLSEKISKLKKKKFFFILFKIFIL